MEIDNPEKIVEFDRYCKRCINKDLDESEDICDKCLSEPTNSYSHKPINYKMIEIGEKQQKERIKKLIEITGCGRIDARKILEKCNWDIDEAVDYIKKIAF